MAAGAVVSTGTMLTVCHPGRYGDLFWALPTIRAMSERAGKLAHLLLPTDPANTTPWVPLLPLLEAQPYIGQATVVPGWSITQDAPRAPRMPDERTLDALGAPYGIAAALGYEHWPEEPLPYEAAKLGGCAYAAKFQDREFFRPWVHAPKVWHHQPYPTIAVSWTDRYFELKLGILSEIRRLMPGVYVQWLAQAGSRMEEAGASAATFEDLANLFAQTDVLLTDCSAAHVLACGIGVPHVLVVEPEEARHHEIFWPGSLTKLNPWQQRDTEIGRRVRPVLGGDGRPTFDSRHTIHALARALERV